MISIKTSNNFILEKEYIIKVLISDFLGLDYKIEISTDINNYYEITLPNNKKILIEDAFWANINDTYLKEEYIPKSVDFIKNDFTSETDIPVIYGSDKLEVNENQIYCGIDIFSSSFFMLTRWEEYVNKTRDQHNRFPATASLAYKFVFLDRPIVNEYVEMLWNMLKFLGYEGKRKERHFEALISHDVDVPFKYNGWKSGLIEIGGDIFKRHSLAIALRNLSQKINSHLKPKSDPFYTFDYLMDSSEKLGLKSHFFFMGGGITNYDNAYNPFSKKIRLLAKYIQNRGHIIGFHGSYASYNNPKQWKTEKENLENSFNIEIKCGRQHYLRFEAPYTWQVWEDNNMQWDSTLSYADRIGFRCGTCFEFPVFNILSKKELKLKEKPLVVMDCCIFDEEYCNYPPEEGMVAVKKLINKCRKYNGTFVTLWHNNYIIKPGKKEFYQQLLQEIK